MHSNDLFTFIEYFDSKFDALSEVLFDMRDRSATKEELSLLRREVKALRLSVGMLTDRVDKHRGCTLHPLTDDRHEGPD